MAVRKKLLHDDKTRQKIQTSQLINRLTDHIHGKVELTASQVRSIEILLKKTLPDLQSIEQIHSGEITTARATELSDDQLAAIISTGSIEGAVTAQESKSTTH